VLLAAVGLVLGTGISAWSFTITQPVAAGGTFVVPGDAQGNPMFFGITATGFTVNEPVFVEQCDGVPSTTTNYQAADHCDIQSSNSPVNADSTGKAFFDPTDSSVRLNVFKGPGPSAPQSFNCLSPHDPSPNNGMPDWRNCQVRVSGGTIGETSEQAFFTIQLPDAPGATTTTITTTTSTTSTTSTTTTFHAQTMSCGMGAGIPQPPPKPPKNSGLVKIAKGLLAAPSVKDTKWKLSGTLDNCVNFPNAPKTGTQIIAGSLKLGVEMPPGASCSTAIPTGTPVKGSWQIKWNATDPKTNLPKAGVAKDGDKMVATFSQAGAGAPITIDATSAPITNPLSLFIGKTVHMHFVMDENQAALDTMCTSTKGIAILHFTGLSGASTLTLS
jgi:hypothetical protein